MKIFGGVLPFIGWRWLDVDSEGEPSEEQTHWFAEALEVEWLGVGAVLYISKVVYSKDGY